MEKIVKKGCEHESCCEQLDLAGWKNQHLTHADRKARAAWGKAAATVGAVGALKLTGGENEAKRRANGAGSGAPAGGRQFSGEL